MWWDNLSTWWKDNSLVKIVQQVIAWTIASVLVIYLAVTIYTAVQPHTPQATIWFNQVIWKLWLDVALFVGGLFLLDWITQKSTLKTILAITDESPPHRIYAATAFYIGFMFALVIVIVSKF